MKQLFFSLLLLLGVNAAHAQIQEVIHQMHVIPRTCKVLNLEIDNSNVEVHYTIGSRMMIETHVKLNHSNHSIMDFMVKNGRYDLSFEDYKDQKEVLLKAKTRLPEIKLRGKVINEEIHYVIYVPKSIEKIYGGEDQLMAIQD